MSDPPVFSPGREQFTLDLAPNTSARISVNLKNSAALPLQYGQLVEATALLQRYRGEYPYESHLLTVSTYLINYPFANRLFPNALDVIDACKQNGQVVILTDGDVVFQPRKIERSGLLEAFDGNILIYIHKEQELADVERRYPAYRYVLVDDKLHVGGILVRANRRQVTPIAGARQVGSRRHSCPMYRQGKGIAAEHPRPRTAPACT